MHPSAEAVALVPAVALAYVALSLRERPGRIRAAAAVLALVLVGAAFATELQPFAVHTFLWAHLLQNVVLAEWAPALLVVAVPPVLGARLATLLPFRPLVALPVWLGAYVAWHLPWVYDAALRRPHTVLHVEHLTYLLAGIALWWPVVHGSYSSGTKAAYLFAAFVFASPIGLVLALVPRPVYAFYRDAPRAWGPRPLADQQIAGVTMAVEEAVVFFSVFAHYLLRFLREEQSAGALAELR
jgi:cytochrome c oxidase assembly factor CtaG